MGERFIDGRQKKDDMKEIVRHLEQSYMVPYENVYSQIDAIIGDCNNCEYKVDKLCLHLDIEVPVSDGFYCASYLKKDLGCQQSQ